MHKRAADFRTTC